MLSNIVLSSKEQKKKLLRKMQSVISQREFCFSKYKTSM